MFDAPGAFVRVGIADSVYEVPDRVRVGAEVNRTRNYVASDDDLTNRHGADVLDIVHHLSTESVFNFYRVTVENGTFKSSNLLRALDDARRHGVAVLNLSLGVAHADCGGRCRVCDAARRIAEDGVFVVAAAGNRLADENDTVRCPARTEGVLSVGASVTRCTASVETERPPGSYWVDHADEFLAETPNEHVYSDEPFCGKRGCSPDHRCSANRTERVAAVTVSERDEIDVLAPGHFPREGVYGCRLDCATSFSTAVVSGIAAALLSELRPVGSEPEPRTLRRALVASGDQLDCGIPRVNARAALDRLRTRHP